MQCAVSKVFVQLRMERLFFILFVTFHFFLEATTDSFWKATKLMIKMIHVDII